MEFPTTELENKKFLSHNDIEIKDNLTDMTAIKNKKIIKLHVPDEKPDISEFNWDVYFVNLLSCFGSCLFFWPFNFFIKS